MIELLIDNVFYKYQKLRDAFPPIVKLPTTCKYSDDRGKCDKGMINWTEHLDDGSSVEHNEPCPQCSGGIGPGVEFETVDSVHGENSDVSGAVKQVEFSIEALKHNKVELQEDEARLFENITGFRYLEAESGVSYQTIPQTLLLFDTATEVLKTLSVEFSRVVKFFIEFIVSSENITKYENIFDYGKDFSLKTVADLQEELKVAKESGSPAFIITEIEDKIVETRFKDLSKRNEALIWRTLEPFAGRTDEEIQFIASKEDRQIKANFPQIISVLKKSRGLILLSELFDVKSESFDNRDYKDVITDLKTEMEQINILLNSKQDEQTEISEGVSV